MKTLRLYALLAAVVFSLAGCWRGWALDGGPAAHAAEPAQAQPPAAPSVSSVPSASECEALQTELRELVRGAIRAAFERAKMGIRLALASEAEQGRVIEAVNSAPAQLVGDQAGMVPILPHWETIARAFGCAP